MFYLRAPAPYLLASLAAGILACGDSGGAGTTGVVTTVGTASVGTESTGVSSSTGSSPTTGTPTTGGTDSGTGSASSSSSDDGGIKFDIAGGGGGDIGGNPGGPGSCRPSEIYGAAGGFPAFQDPAYAPFLDRAVAIVTHTNYDPPPNNFSMTIVDISGAPPPAN